MFLVCDVVSGNGSKMVVMRMKKKVEVRRVDISIYILVSNLFLLKRLFMLSVCVCVREMRGREGEKVRGVFGFLQICKIYKIIHCYVCVCVCKFEHGESEE